MKIKLCLALLCISTTIISSSIADRHKTAQLLESIKPLAKNTARQGSPAELGSFAALFDLKATNYQDPLLISTTDGAGAKMHIAQTIGKHNTIGTDLVALSVNDLLAQGAEPLFFLDYYATGNLDLEEGTQLITGMALGCKKGGCALVGGETSEVPSLYKKGTYDIAGFAVGVVERDQLLPKMETIREGDAVIGVASNGLHAHGFTVLDQLIQEYSLNLNAPPMYLSTEQSLAHDLLRPTHIYVNAILPLCKQNKIKSIAHVAGGGLIGSIERAIPMDMQTTLNIENWYIPPVFRWIKQLGKFDDQFMMNSFNVGIGLALVVDKNEAPKIISHIRRNGFEANSIGSVRPALHGDQVQINGTIKNMRMRVMVIGSGASEHALATKIAQSPHTELVCIAPGNAGTFSEDKIKNIPINPTHVNALITYAQKNQIDLTIVGAEDINTNLVDEFQAKGLRCLGPQKRATQLEKSYNFAKQFMRKYAIPTPDFKIFSNPSEAKKYVETCHVPLTIKSDTQTPYADSIALTHDQAFAIIDQQCTQKNNVIVEPHPDGHIVQILTLCDGTSMLPLTHTQNYKYLQNGDRGPLTDGMGAYSPAPIITPELEKKIIETIVQPTIAGMQAEEIAYQGFLETTVLIEKDGTPKALSYVCRLSDPNAQTALMRLKSDLLVACNAACEKKLHTCSLEWDEKCCMSIVLAAPGYPMESKKGDTIIGFPEHKQELTKVLHGATTYENGQLVINGGRVLCVTGLGKSMQEARSNVYQIASQIYWPDIQYRNDIGYKAMIK